MKPNTVEFELIKLYTHTVLQDHLNLWLVGSPNIHNLFENVIKASSFFLIPSPQKTRWAVKK